MMTIEEKVIRNINNITLRYEAEDENRPATMRELQRAISLASSSEKISAVTSNHIPYMDGYIVMSF